MEEDTCTLVFKVTMSSGETRRHSYDGCPFTLDAFNKWWAEQMKPVFHEKGLRHWLKFKNPTIFYHVDNVASIEIEHNAGEEFNAILEEKMEFMSQITGPG